MKIDEGPKSTHWPSLLILVCLVLGSGFYFLGSIGFLLNTFYQYFEGGGDPVGAWIAAMTTAFEGVLLLFASWFVFLKTSGAGNSDPAISINIPESHVFLAIIIGVAAFSIGCLVSIRGNLWSGLLTLPAMTIIVILIPIILFANWALRNINLDLRWRTWGVFGLGMTLTPLFVVSIEVILAIIFIIAIALAIVSQPESFNEFSRIVQNINPQSGQEKFFEIFASFLMKPGVIAGILLYLSVLVPLVEELFKPLGVWLFSSQINHPSQGFGLGIVCGVAFAIIEGLGISGQGGPQWAVVVGLRAGTSLLHIATTGLMGYAIVSAIKKKQIPMLVGTYLVTVSIHGLWNAAAAGMGISVISGYSGIDDGLRGLLPASIGGITVLATGLLMLLPRINRRLAV